MLTKYLSLINKKLLAFLLVVILSNTQIASAQSSSVLVNFANTGPGAISISLNVAGGEKISGVDLDIVSSDVTFSKIGPVRCQDKDKTLTDIINKTSGKSARVVSVLFEKSVDLCSKLVIPLEYVGQAKGTVVLNRNSSQVSGTGQNLIYTINSNELQLGSGDRPFEPLPPDDFVSPVPGQDQNGDINLRFSPNTLNLAIGQTAVQQLILRSSDGVKKISAWDIDLEYTGSRVKIASVGGKGDQFFEGEEIVNADDKCTALEKVISPSKNSVRLSYTCLLPDSDLPTAVQIPLRLTGISEGNSSVRIKSVEVVGNISDNYTVGRGRATVNVGSGKNIPDPDEPDNSTGGSSVNLNMSFRLQGVPTRPQKPRPVKMKIGFGDGGLVKSKFVTGTFNFDENGLLKGNVATNLPSLQNLKVLAKCGHCIQKKICDLNPTETVAGIYVCDKGKIPLKSGANQIDFSTILLLVGDLGEQDGVTNSFDVAMVRNNFGKTDEASLALADLNFDGEVNTQDYGLIIRALSVKRDEP